MGVGGNLENCVYLWKKRKNFKKWKNEKFRHAPAIPIISLKLQKLDQNFKHIFTYIHTAISMNVVRS